MNCRVVIIFVNLKGCALYNEKNDPSPQKDKSTAAEIGICVTYVKKTK